MTISTPPQIGPARLSTTRIAFIEAKFPDPDYTTSKLVKRLEKHLVKIRTAKPASTPTKLGVDQSTIEERTGPDLLPFSARQSIRRRVTQLVERRRLSTQMGHLPDHDIKKLAPVRNGVELVRIASEHRADEIAAAVHSEFPWLAPATDVFWQAMRRSVRNGDAGFRLPPLLLDGPPGIGKSSWARFLSGLIGIPSVEIDASSESAGFGMVGQERGWGKAEPGRPVNLILQERVGNPLLVIDDIDKAGLARSQKGEAYRLTDAMLPLLEPATARRWNCPFFRLAMNMGWISWIMTSNDALLLPEPLRSRCVILELRNLTVAELIAFAFREQVRRGLSDDVMAGVIGALKASPRMKRAPSLRTVLRLLDLAEVQEDPRWLH